MKAALEELVQRADEQIETPTNGRKQDCSFGRLRYQDTLNRRSTGGDESPGEAISRLENWTRSDWWAFPTGQSYLEIERLADLRRYPSARWKKNLEAANALPRGTARLQTARTRPSRRAPTPLRKIAEYRREEPLRKATVWGSRSKEFYDLLESIALGKAHPTSGRGDFVALLARPPANGAAFPRVSLNVRGPPELRGAT